MSLRIAAVVVGALVAGLAVLYAIGRRPLEIETRIRMAAPPKRVFAALTEPEQLLRWIPGLESTTPLTDGGLRVGARSREVLVEHGRRMTAESTVTALEHDRLLAVTLEGSGMHGELEYRLAPTPDGTDLTFRESMRFSGVAVLFAVFVRGSAIRHVEESLARLKALVEAG